MILVYAYDANDRLTNRWSAAKGNTGYAFDDVGNLTGIHYPASSSVSFTYDELNRLTQMVDGIGTTAYSYTAGNQLLTEDGPFDSDTVTNTYAYRLRTELDLEEPAGVWTNVFGYDAAKRLTNVISPAGSFGYAFVPAGVSHHASLVTLPNSAVITNGFDSVARQTATYLENSGGTVLDSYEYAYNQANQRTGITRADASTVSYGYDKIGQLKVADSSVNTEDRGYTYDAAWNLNYRTNNGAFETVGVNSLNELTTAFGSSFLYDSNGNLTNGAGVSYAYDDENRLIDVSQGTPSSGAWRSTFGYDGLGRMRLRTEYRGNGSSWIQQSQTEYIYDGMRVIQERDSSNTPTVSYTRGTDLSGSLEGAGGIGGLLARSSAADINTNTTLNIYVTNGSALDFYVWIYSDAGTNVDSYALSAYSDASFSITADAGVQYTVYGMDSLYHEVDFTDTFIAALDHRSGTIFKDYSYEALESGSALSGLAGNWPHHDYYFADANGNITALVDTNQSLSASYRYDPFGNTISKSGTVSDANVYRFSSKEIHLASGMYYYGYRFYDPSLQRWVNRDPLEELGGINLFTFVRNQPTTTHDKFGLIAPMSPCQAAMDALDAALADADEEAAETGSVSPSTLAAINAARAAVAANCPDKKPPQLPPQPPGDLVPCPSPNPYRYPPGPPPSHQTFCQSHPAVCVGIGVGVVGIAVGATCIFQPELCVGAIRIGVGIGEGVIKTVGAGVAAGL